MNIRCLKKARRMKFTQWLLLYSKQILCMMSNVTELKKDFQIEKEMREFSKTRNRLIDSSEKDVEFIFPAEFLDTSG